MLLDHLRSPEAYRTLGFQGASVRTVETHHAWVFLIGEHALKLKKPVRSRWLDFSTPALRETACRQEWLLNQALAPGVYLGVVQALRGPEGWQLRRMEPSEPSRTVAIDAPLARDHEDWLVLMRRLPEQRMLDRMIETGTLCTEAVDRLARVLCGFWAGARKVPHSPEAWLKRWHDALDQRAQDLARLDSLNTGAFTVVAPSQIRRALDGCQRLLKGCERDLLQRARQGRVLMGHGDLRPEHVHLPPPPGRPLVIDRLEFNETLREVDPFEELAFLAVECRRLGAPWVGRRLFARCGRVMDDRPPHRLLRLYTAQRALLQAILALAHLEASPVRDGRPWRARAGWYIECAVLAAGADTTGPSARLTA